MSYMHAGLLSGCEENIFLSPIRGIYEYKFRNVKKERQVKGKWESFEFGVKNVASDVLYL